MLLPASTVAKKILMAVTGQLMVLFVIFHVIGNSTIYFGTINAYAAALHISPLLVWIVRAILAIIVVLHIYLAIVLTVENGKAKPDKYEVTKQLSSTFAGRTMIWTGALIGSFLAYHLLHFTAQVIDPRYAAYLNPDALGRPDVHLMVVHGLQNALNAAIYIMAFTALMLHLSHGIHSSFQTWGLNSERSFPIITAGGKAAALALALAYAAILLTVMTGLLK